MTSIMRLVQESKIYNLSQGQVWKDLLKHRWADEILKRASPCPNETEIASMILKIQHKFGLELGMGTWVTEKKEDLAFGTELLSALHFCPDHIVETVKLSVFFENLVNNQNLKTLVAATIHNLPPRASGKITDFSSMNMWYDQLSRRYNFSLGSSIIGLLTTEHLKQLALLDPPYLRQYKDAINLCLNEQNCGDLSENIGKRPVQLRSLIRQFQMVTHPW